MSSINPYEPPREAIDAISPVLHSFGEVVETLWRDGNKLVVARHALQLPDRCVRTNQPTTHRRPMKFQYVPNSAMWTFMFGVIGAAIAQALYGQKIEVGIPVHPDWLAERKRHLWRGWLVVALGGALILLAMVGIVVFEQFGDSFLLASVLGIPAGALVCLGGLVYMMIKAPAPIRFVELNRDFVWFDKVHPEYLLALPPVPPDARRRPLR